MQLLKMWVAQKAIPDQLLIGAEAEVRENISIDSFPMLKTEPIVKIKKRKKPKYPRAKHFLNFDPHLYNLKMKTEKILFYLEVNHISFAEYARNHIHTLMISLTLF